MYTSSYWQVKNNSLGIQSEATGSFASAIAVLELLLSTFNSEGTCLSMMLLGLVSSDASRGALPATSPPWNFLEAVLHILSPQYFGPKYRTTLVQQCPPLALACFELLHALCSCRTTHSAVLEILRKKSFFARRR